MKHILFMIIVALVAAQSSQAQVGVPNQDRPNQLEQAVFGLGLSAGYVSGFGLSFRHHLATPFSYQIVGGIIKIDAKTYYNIGGEAQYDLSRGETSRFYAAGGMGYFNVGASGNNDLDGPFRLGLGIGVEKSHIESFSLSGELLFTYFSDGTVLPLPQISAHYYFY